MPIKKNKNETKFDGANYEDRDPRLVFVRGFVVDSIEEDCPHCERLKESETYQELKRNIHKYAPKCIERIQYQEIPCEWMGLSIKRYTDHEVKNSEWILKRFELDDESLNFLMALSYIYTNFPMLEIIWQTYDGKLHQEIVGGLVFAEEDHIVIADLFTKIFEKLNVGYNPDKWKKYQHEKARLSSTKGDTLLEYDTKEDD